MKFDAFFGGSYESQAITADCERTINWYPEVLQSQGATARRVLYPTPGVEVIPLVGAPGFPTLTVQASPGRAHYSVNGREFAVIGDMFYEFSRSGILSASQISGDPVDGLPATISYNGDGGAQLFVTAGGNGYSVDISTTPSTAIAPIAALAGKAHFGAHLDGYFLTLDTSTSTLYVSDLYDGTTWDTGGTFAQRSLGSDRWRSMAVNGRTVWLFGEYTSEPWHNTGERFPFAPAPAGVIEFGISSPWSAKVLGNTIFWQGNSRNGRICVLRASGYAPEVVSTYPLEKAMQGYQSITTAVADAYTDAGHSFYLLNFDLDGVTWALDAETGLWHERGTWNPASNAYSAWRPRFYAYAFGEHRMLDTSNGNVYRMSSDLNRDVDGRLIRRLRRAPAINEENARVFYSALELDIEPGLGLQAGHVGFQAIPVITTVSGEVTLDGDPVPDVEVIVEVDGVDVGTTTTDEDGEYELEGVPDGEVTAHAFIEIDDVFYCAEDTGTATGTGVFTSPGTLVLNLTLSVCGLSASFTAVSTGAFGPDSGTLTLTPTVTNGSGDYSYLWTAWTEHGGTENAPDFTSTDEIGIWEWLYDIAEDGICTGEAKLIVTDNATGASVISGPDPWTWQCV
jgi:hypothetical protein